MKKERRRVRCHLHRSKVEAGSEASRREREDEETRGRYKVSTRGEILKHRTQHSSG